MRNVHRLAALGAILVASQASMCSPDNQAKAPSVNQASAAAAPPKLTLVVSFDGGYLYDFSQADTIDVHSLQAANYKMTARIVSDNNRDVPLDGFTATFRPDGAAPAARKPGVPPLDASATDCKDADKTNPNNRFFIPNLDEVAAAMGTTVRTEAPKAATMRLGGGGALAVHAVGGCVEFRHPNGSAFGAPRSMASGIEGIEYEWRDISASSVTLVRTNAAGVEQLEVLKPNNSQIVIRVSAAFGAGTTDPNPHAIGHFKAHFDDAFKHIDETKRISLWWSKQYLVSPGIDCPPGSSGS